LIDDLYGDTIVLRFIEGLTQSAPFARQNLYTIRQRINQLLTKTADL
jgi:hypothetical protein